MISKEQREEWRTLAENKGGMISALGEYTPPEFIELLDAYEELEAQNERCNKDLIRQGDYISRLRSGQ